MSREDLWKVNSNCSVVSFPVTEVPLKEVYLYQVKHNISVLQQNKESTLGTALTLCTDSPVLFEPLAQGGFSPIQRRWKRHKLEFFVHTESKKASSSLGFLSRSLPLHHLFLLQKPRSGVVCSMEFSLPHLPAIVLGFFIVCLFVLYSSFCGFDSDINVYRLLDFFLL